MRRYKIRAATANGVVQSFSLAVPPHIARGFGPETLFNVELSDDGKRLTYTVSGPAEWGPPPDPTPPGPPKPRKLGRPKKLPQGIMPHRRKTYEELFPEESYDEYLITYGLVEDADGAPKLDPSRHAEDVQVVTPQPPQVASPEDVARFLASQDDT